jgi:ubiquinone biosynthesis protein
VKNSNSASFFKLLDFNEILLQSYSFARDASKLPSKILELSDGLLNGRAKVQLQLTGLNKSVNEVNKMANRLVIGVIVASLIVSSAMILTSNVGPKLFNMSIIGITGYAMSAIIGLWLLVSIVKSGKL